MKNRIQYASIWLLLVSHIATVAAQDLEWDVGLSANRTVIHARGIRASSQPAPTVLYLAGLNGETVESERVRSIFSAYSQLKEQDRPVNLITIPLANPDAEGLRFPPDGNAYAENTTSNVIWRWLGVHAPDVIILADEESGLASALQSESVAAFGAIPVQRLSATTSTIEYLRGMSTLEPSAARIELERRLNRSPEQLARQLAEIYGHDFSSPAYVPGMGLIGRMRLGEIEDIETLLQPYLTEGAIDVSNASILAGQLVFAEHAERTGNARSLQLAINAADLAFDAAGNMLEAMPMHSEMSDSLFMATPLLVKVGKLTGNPKYFDMAARHVEFMRALLLRDDGLYRHSPLADVAWGRGNAFPALGLALSLSDFPETHPAFPALKQAYLQQMETLRPFVDAEGMWHEVIDYPGSFAELSATAMIGIAIKRGIDRGWLSSVIYQPILDRTWNAVLTRTSMDGVFIDVCTSTGKLQSLDAYLDRLAIFDLDDRAGGMVMNFANEMASTIK